MEIVENECELIPSLCIIFQKMGICSFCKIKLGEEAVGLNYLSTMGYFVCNDIKCKNLSYNYKYFIIRSVHSIGIKEPFQIRINSDKLSDKLSDKKSKSNKE